MTFRDSQEHALVCEVISMELTQKELENLNKTENSYLFGNIEEQHNITKMFQIIISTRERMLTIPEGLPGHYNLGPD